MKPFLALLAMVVMWCAAQAQTVPEWINYQGRLIEGTILFNGTVPITFNLYNAGITGIDADGVALAVIQELKRGWGRRFNKACGVDVSEGGADLSAIARRATAEHRPA